MGSKEYQIIIIGGGPAGLTAGLYCARGKWSTLLLEKEIIGGQAVNIEKVENYPGFPEGIPGFELARLWEEQAVKYGIEIMSAEAISLELNGSSKIVKTTRDEFRAPAVIIAGGTKRSKLGVPGEEEFKGRGVSYCATCDAPLFQKRVVAVVGGGNAAITEALALAKFASRVKVIHRRDQLRATKVLQERAFAEPKIEFLWNTTVEEIVGGDMVREIKLRQLKTGAASSLPADGVFIAIGLKPNTDYLRGLLTLDEEGHIITNDAMETEVPGILAAGDIRHKLARQIITAAGDGATAAVSAERFLSHKG